jgi:hypothetical protein
MCRISQKPLRAAAAKVYLLSGEGEDTATDASLKAALSSASLRDCPASRQRR